MSDFGNLSDGFDAVDFSDLVPDDIPKNAGEDDRVPECSSITLDNGDVVSSCSRNLGGAPKSWRMVEITQQCRYGWTVDKVREFLGLDDKNQPHWSPVQNYYFIDHNKDFKDANRTHPDFEHIHLIIRFRNPIRTEVIFSRFDSIGLDSEHMGIGQLQKIHTWSGAVNYLTHRDELNTPNKSEYSVDEVVTNCDYESDAHSAHMKKVLKIDEARKAEIMDNILNGTWKEYQLYGDNSPVTDFELVQLDSSIKTSLKIFYKKTTSTVKTRELSTLLITGPAGSGKDVLAKTLLDSFGVPYAIANNGDHPFDDYQGQPGFIWSDARDSVFKFRELLTLLDPWNRAPAPARYYDRCLLAEYFIMTSVVSLKSWYKSYFEKAPSSDNALQLYRRIPLIYQLHPVDSAGNSIVDVYQFEPSLFKWDMSFRSYTFPYVFKGHLSYDLGLRNT